MSKRRVPKWVWFIVGAPALLLLFIAGLWGYVLATTRPLHPEAAAVPSNSSATPPQWSAAVERARQIARAELLEQNLPGLSVAVGAGGELVWAEGVGWADMDSRAAVTPGTRFRLGMGSKVLTSAAVGRLLDQGRLNLDDEIQKYVPDYPRAQWPVTVRQVMAHMAGIGTDGGDEGPRNEHCERTLEGLRLFKDRKLLFEPGTAYRYSNYGWILVSAAVESAAEEPFFSHMRRHIFEPLGMSATVEDDVTHTMADRATFYFPRFAADTRYGPQGIFENDVDYSCFAGSGNFLSTPSDLVRFGLAVQKGTLMQPATAALLQTSMKTPAGEETGYGLGWDLETADIAGKPARVVGHDGDWMGGRVMSFLIIPEHNLIVAVASNEAWADTYRIGVKIADVFATTGSK